MSQQISDAFNLLEEKWIPVLYGNGKTDRVGIYQALLEARKIRQIAATNPMDRVALLRFLLAVLMWCKENAKSSLAALKEKSAGIPDNWLVKLEENKAAFNLLGRGTRFYQDESLEGTESRPIGDLLVEFPGADSVNHIRHVVHDGSYGFCPACCAMGIVRLSVWASANKFFPASVNPASAAYAFIEGKDFFETLYQNIPQTNPQADQAPWLDNNQPNSPDAIARLAWRPRKLWLNVGSKNDRCANCGSFGELITSLCNKGGWPTPTTGGRMKKFWDMDPHLLRDDEPISLPRLEANSARHSSKFWRDAFRLRGQRQGKVSAIGPVVNKFTFQDATSVSVPNPAASQRVARSARIQEDLRRLVKHTTPNSNRVHPEIDAATVLATADAEARVQATLPAECDDKAFLRAIYEPVVEQIVACTATGSPLRRRVAREDAKHWLNSKIKGLVENPTDPSNDRPLAVGSNNNEVAGREEAQN